MAVSYFVSTSARWRLRTAYHPYAILTDAIWHVLMKISHAVMKIWNGWHLTFRS